MCATCRCPATPGRWLIPPLLALALAVPAQAQDSLSLRVGQMVRFQYRGHPGPSYEGRLLSVSDDSLALESRTRPGTAVTVARSDMCRIWVSDGRSRRTGAGLGIGLFVGAVLGGVLGAVSYEPCSDCFMDLGDVASAAKGAAGGAALGMVVGGIAGASTVREHWRAIDMAPAVTLAPAGATRFGLGARVPLGGGPPHGRSGT